MAGRKNRKGFVDNPVSEDSGMTLRSVCESCDDVKAYFKAGLGAFENKDKAKIKVPNTSLLGGSVNLDDAAKAEYPKENRWDYALEFDGKTFFIEVHPSFTSEIDCVVKKVEFVKRWLRSVSPEILALPGPGKFYWVSSGSTDLRITPNSPQAQKLAMHKIVNVGRVWDYGKVGK